MCTRENCAGLVPAADLAVRLHVDGSTVYRLARRGEITMYRVGRQLRFCPPEVIGELRAEAERRSESQVPQVDGKSVNSWLDDVRGAHVAPAVA